MKLILGKLTYANVVATIALFVALGGVGYAAVKLPPNSVGAKQIKRAAVTSAKLKDGAVTGAKVKLATLGTVPNAAHADEARHAARAETAATAGDAGSLQGQSAAQIAAAAKLTCPAGTALVGGVCFETQSREPERFLGAVATCAKAERFLPSLSQLWTYEHKGTAPSAPSEWVGQAFWDGTGPKAMTVLVFPNGYTVNYGEKADNLQRYRCVTMPSN